MAPKPPKEAVPNAPPPATIPSEVANAPLDTSSAQAGPGADAPVGGAPDVTKVIEPNPAIPDLAAPYGRKADGTPRAKPGRPAGVPNREETKEDANKAAAEAVRRAQRKARLSTVGSNPAAAQAPGAPIVPQALIGIDYDSIGREFASMWFLGGTLAFGADWTPEPTEGKAIEKAFSDWARARKMTGLSPDYALIAVLGMYTLTRVQKPTVRERIGKAWSWIKTRSTRMISR